jgi:hypothetical protein
MLCRSIFQYHSVYTLAGSAMRAISRATPLSMNSWYFA